MLSDSERAIAIREGHRNAADAAYFNERPHLADDNGIRVFDAGFDRGWDAACAERDARIAELEADLRAESDRRRAEIQDRERLTRELEEARKDAELLDWMIFYSARLSHSNDAECCQVIWINEDGEQRTKLFGNAREAIRAAIKEQT